VDPPSTDDLRRWGALLTDGTRFSVAVYLRTLGASFKLLVIGG
jgi:hypothetical protein